MSVFPANVGLRIRRPFAAQQPWDRNVFLLLMLLVWLGIVVGFGHDIADHIRTHRRAYPLIVHIHAAVFVGWLVLVTTQMLLVRVRRTDIHRKLGLWGMALAATMAPLGLAAAWLSERLDHGTPNSDAPFFAVNITTMLAFVVLVAAAYGMRSEPPAHKRLLLLATICLSFAGFARWWSFAVGDALGSGFWPFFVMLYLASDILIVGLGAYDLATRGRLHPAYVAGTLWILANQLAGNWLYFAPRWKPIATWLAGY
jgi:hypothetical protein